MIVEPTPTNPRSPVRRALRLAGLALPVVLLAGVAIAGLVGPKVETQAPLVATAPPEAPAASPSLSPSASGETRPIELAGGPFVPPAVADLLVRSVPATLKAHDTPGGTSIVAIAGYLRDGGSGVAACRLEAVLPGSACAREVVIAETTGIPDNPGFGGFGSHIHATVPPGVLLPGDPGGPVWDPGGDYPFVVIIGRFGATRGGCTADMRGCDDPFTVERVAWVDGAAVVVIPAAQTSQIASPSDPVMTDPLAAARAALGPTTVLLRVLLLGAGLGAVDPAAADAVADWSAGPEGGPVWYLRVLDVPGSPLAGPFKGLQTPQIRWAVVSQRTRTVIGTGLVPGSPTAAATGRG